MTNVSVYVQEKISTVSCTLCLAFKIENGGDVAVQMNPLESVTVCEFNTHLQTNHIKTNNQKRKLFTFY